MTRRHLLASLLILLLPMPFQSEAHEWYTDQKNEKGDYCCGGSDCAGSDYRVRRVAGGYEIDIPVGSHPKVTTLDYAPGAVITFKFVGNPGISPDGQVHVCIVGKAARCLFIGGSV